MVPKDHIIRYQGIPKPSKYWVIFGIVISLLIHVISVINLEAVLPSGAQKVAKRKKKEVKVRMIPAEKVSPKKILEAKQRETKAPKHPKYLGHTDHSTLNETKTMRSEINSGEAEISPSSSTQNSAQGVSSKPKLGVGSETLSSDDGENSIYQNLLPKSNDLAQLRQKNYQEYIDENVAVGEIIDINTSSYRFIGYFTGLRKGWSQTWVYPSEAVRKGLQGNVRVQLTIAKDGRLQRVKLIETSGYDILDQAVIDAVRLSAPYAPLPVGFGKDKLTIATIFSYQLSNFGSVY